MSSIALRSATAARSTIRGGGAAKRAAVAISSTTFVRGKATLPDLPYDYGALEPAISGKIMELHHSKHHQTYVTGYNTASEQLAAAEAKNDVTTQIALLPLINFHGGGHTNHSLFWENLAPKGRGGGGEPEGPLKTAIEAAYGSHASFIKTFNAALAGIQGSGWAWLVRDNETGQVQIKTYANQDPVVGKFTPVLGIDAWEHAYYLQYENRKAEYFNAVWDVVNWKAAEKRFQ